MAARLLHMVGIVKEALFPARCIGCDAICPWPTPSVARSPMTGFLCPQCEDQLALIRSPLCVCCGQPFVSDQGVDHLCVTCCNSTFSFQGARAAGLYANALQALIYQYKYRGCEPLAGPLGHLLWQTFWRHWTLDDVDILVPVPLHPRRMRKRGFNQAGLLLRIWPRLASEQGVYFDRHRIFSGTLVRQRHTPPQTGLDRKARKKNMRGAFGFGKGAVNGLHVLLVDDVLTTGATANACARILMRAGAASVKVLTLARAAQ